MHFMFGVKALFCSGCFLIGAVALASQDIDQAAETFLRNLTGTPNGARSLQFQRNLAGRPFGKAVFYWSAGGQGRSLTIAEETATVLSYVNSDVESLSFLGPRSKTVPQTGRPFFTSEAALVGRAKSVLAKVGWHVGAQPVTKPLPKKDKSGEIARQLLMVEFHERPFGFPSGRTGDYSIVTLDSLSGAIASLDQRVGCTYERPPAKILSRAEVQARVKKSLSEDLKESQISGPRYNQLYSQTTLSPRGVDLCKRKIVPLVYTATTGSGTLLIDAGTGEVLSRISGAAGNGPTPRNLPEARKKVALFLLYGLATSAALLVGRRVFTKHPEAPQQKE
jgi:hypothetical protein